MTHDFPGLSDTMQDAARLARTLELTLLSYNSGSPRNSKNGFRIFHGIETPGRDYFRGDHLTHLTTKAEVMAWLDGYRTAAKPVSVPLSQICGIDAEPMRVKGALG